MTVLQAIGEFFDVPAILNILLWFTVVVILVPALFALRFWGTKWIDEMAEIFEKGNVAVTLMLSGKLIGLALIVGSAIRNNETIVALVVTTALGWLLQVVAYVFVDRLFVRRYDFNSALLAGNAAAGGFIGAGLAVIGYIIAQVIA